MTDFPQMPQMPQMCGGLSQSVDENAPKQIVSEDMTLFKVESAVIPMVTAEGTAPVKIPWFSFISVYAAKCADGVFLMLYARDRYGKRECEWRYIKDDIFQELVSAVKNNNLARSNGTHSFTYGLPENFGGEVRIDYSSGEKIDFSGNQSPVISMVFADWLYEYFGEALKKKSVSLPDVNDIKTIRFDSVRNDGGYTHVILSDKGNGMCEYKRERKYEFSDVYRDEKEMPAEFMDKLRGIIDNNAMLVWHMLPENGFKGIEEKTMTFVFKDGSEIVVPSSKILPNTISGAFFSIELEMK